MITGVSFQTKARTVDHLGREQIADTPTAISELWKNAFDAYARYAELNIYDGDPTVASIVDDGHGMDRAEFVSRWLVVGTESKATTDRTPLDDRNGLRHRTRQGQKGIGRLSCAKLGPILCFISKRKQKKFVAALVDWRLFENPFLNLSDIRLPVTEFEAKEEFFSEFPGLVAELLENVTGGEENDRSDRVRRAWSAFDALYAEERDVGTSKRSIAPSVEVTSSLKGITFEERHLRQWKLWNGECEHGTALLVACVNHDLEVQLDDKISDSSDERTKKRFFETLSSFVDPFVDPSNPEVNATDPQFSNAVRAWKGDKSGLVLGTEKQFNLTTVQPMEHQIVGQIDDAGTFRGKIRAFGEWVSGECVIGPPKNLRVPDRADSRTGPFDIYIAAMEFDRKNTTHTREEFTYFQNLAELYAGFMVYRDGLRVLPFGRTDNDFFEIEYRRSKNAGREFWNHRQMFGRLAISRSQNPNLTDKAGREGLLDNTAAKTLRELVSNILMQSARQYFGSASDLRKELLPEIQGSNREQRANEARNKLRSKHRKEFRNKLRALSGELPSFLNEVSSLSAELIIESEEDIENAQSRVEDIKTRSLHFKLPGAPKDLGSSEDQYLKFRQTTQAALAEIESISQRVDEAIERVKPTSPRVLLEKQLSRNAAQIHHRLRGWKKEIEGLQRQEFERVRLLFDQRNKYFHVEATPLLHRLDTGESGYLELSKLMDRLRVRIDAENEELFAPYVGALESLKESVDLEHLATFGMEELSELRIELERLNSLAQLGIAVEIVGHELQSYDEIIGEGLRRLPHDVKESKAAKDIEFGYEGLADQLRFLSPLRLAGQKVQRWMTGDEIFSYISSFFKIALANNGVTFEASESFKSFRVFDVPSRLYPVFINIVNNSIYWLSLSSIPQRRIIFDVLDKEIVISDNGPGVDPLDVPSLFSLFFTKKIRGGRGVGLYLSRSNLAAGGHRIRYEPNPQDLPLQGANFVIAFRGAEFSDN
ncbi:histidine kinase [Rhizobium leguminosarum bv. viciae]|uniref:ATP-binding protein n=1 Tax=Rhizobium leguminosarum TaxID=384 RepID=UPI001441E975|nr:ATP-binding protein [Rhizobium leguminosarum]NKJ97113.1 histidine kinase [Rhizobium leguminosarum bv. viciae]